VSSALTHVRLSLFLPWTPADIHRKNDSTCTVLLRAPKKVEARPPGGKPARSEGGAVDFVGLDDKKSRLLFLKPAADVEDKIVLPKRQLTQYPVATITNKVGLSVACLRACYDKMCTRHLVWYCVYVMLCRHVFNGYHEIEPCIRLLLVVFCVLDANIFLG
jgi:hypothetical protein